MAKQKASESIPQSEGIFYVKEGQPARAVYTPADRVQVEWDGFKPAETKANQAAAEEQFEQIQKDSAGDPNGVLEDTRP